MEEARINYLGFVANPETNKQGWLKGAWYSQFPDKLGHNGGKNEFCRGKDFPQGLTGSLNGLEATRIYGPGAQRAGLVRPSLGKENLPKEWLGGDCPPFWKNWGGAHCVG